MKDKTQRLPHDFQPGKDPKFPGPYCRYCHFSIVYADANGCPKRRRRAAQFNDRQRLDFWQRHPENVGHKHGQFYAFGRTYCEKGTSIRRVLDAAMRADRKARARR